MAGKALILRWTGSAYDSLGGLLDLTADALRQEGWKVVTFPADGADWTGKIGPLLAAQPFDFALTMSGIGVDLMLNQRPVWEAAKVPLFNWNCDHPSYFPARHAMRSRFLLHGYVFPDHARYSMSHLNLNRSAFTVHLGMPPRDIFPAAPLPPEARNGRIIFSKTGRDTNAIEATWQTYPPPLGDILFAAAEQLSAGHTAEFLPELQRVAEAEGLYLSGDNQLALLLIKELDSYIRFRRGNLVMRSVLRYPVDVFGTGWDHIPAATSGAAFHGAITWRDGVAGLPAYLGCLSINPMVNESVHDRVFFALSAGVTPISDSNAFSRARMPGLEPYAFAFGTEAATRHSIEAAVDALLANPAAARQSTETAWQALRDTFSLRHGARQIIGFSRLHKTNAPDGS